MIEVTGLRKSFGSVTAVRDVSFRADDGLVTGLLGPNGAGKTTTLRVLTGLMSPDAGSASVDGIDSAQNPFGVQSRIGVLPDSRGLYPRLTAREHVEYFGRLQGVPEATLQSRSEQLLGSLGLTAIADRRVAGFSQGERNKVALARALVHEPQNVILDEPTTGLDVTSTRAIRTLIEGLRRRRCCVLFSSHVMQEVSALCDRVVLIARGKVVADGTLDSLRAQTGCDNLEDAYVALAGWANNGVVDMSVRQSWIVFRKEIVDGLRDRAAVTTVLLQAISSPIVYGVILMVLAGRDVQPTLTLPVAGGEHAPALVAWLERQNDVEVAAAPADPQAAVRAGSADVVLVISPEFAERNVRGLTANVRLVQSDGGASRRAAERARGLITAYGAEVAALRLTARGVAPAVMVPVGIEAVDVSAPPRSNGGFLMFVPILLLWLAMSAGGAIALESTVGERERGSLEPLLLNPIARPAVVIGKWLASSVFACGSVVAAMLATIIILHWVPWHEYGLQMKIRDSDVLFAGLVMLPLAVLMGAAVMLVSAVARSLQQGQAYLAVLAMTTVLCAMASFVFELADVTWIAPIPISGQIALVADVLAGSSPEPLRYALSALGSGAAAVLLIVVTTMLLRRESIVFRS